jgi:hypothetical protein
MKVDGACHCGPWVTGLGTIPHSELATVPAAAKQM